MAVDGKWKITLSTPMGPQKMTAELTTEGSTLSGYIQSDIGSEKVNGTVDGDSLNWQMDVTKPMKIKLNFDVKVEGDNMTGKVKLGMLGNADLTGVRA